MNLTKRSPLLRNTQEGFDRAVGNLGEELSLQELETANGGNWPIVNELLTRWFKCGVVWSFSAECSRTGHSC